MSEQRTSAYPKIQFVARHQPRLESGDYRMTVTQTVDGKGIEGQNFFTDQKKFVVAGERFTLKPDEVSKVFPPPENLGEYVNVLPHIVLKRSTMPWERMAIQLTNDERAALSTEREHRTPAQKSLVNHSEEKKETPWLALLLLHEDELVHTIAQDEFGDALNTTLVGSSALSPSDSQSIWQSLVRHRWLRPLGASKLSTEILNQQQREPLDGLAATHESQIRSVLAQSSGPKIMTVKQFHLGSTHGSIRWPAYELETAQKHDLEAKITTIDVRKKNLQALLPTDHELRFLSHVRQPIANADVAQQVKNANEARTDEQAIIVCNRLPHADGKSILHLVSVEERYNSSGFDYQDAGDQELIRLVSLKSWQFTCLSQKHTFTGLLTHLNHPLLFTVADDDSVRSALANGTIPARLKQAFASQYAALSETATVNGNGPWTINDGNERYIISKVSHRLDVHRQDQGRSHTLRLPDHADPNNSGANSYLAAGYAPVRHTMRSGEKSVSWYRGPLSTANYRQGAEAIPQNLFPVRAADSLVRYDQRSGMFDVSYAAAWELGRSMALKSKHFSITLYQWKRAHCQKLRQVEVQELHPHLSVHTSPTDQLSLPASLESWLSQTSLLHDMPFNYLVPNEAMLPPESIRFFTLDPLWIACLIDGAYSVGRVTSADHQSDRKTQSITELDVSGILVRSEVVSGWPDLEVTAYDSVPVHSDQELSSPLSTVRMERLSPNVLIVLFAGDAHTVDIHEKPETIHFGLTETKDDDGHSHFSKTLRNSDGIEMEASITTGASKQQASISAVPFRVGDGTVVNISELSKQVSNQRGRLGFDPDEPINAAQFALEMIEGVQKVRFVREKDGH